MTSIEWLASKLSVTFNTMYADEIEQAKEMEKQQIMDAYLLDEPSSAKKYAEQYYNETYKNK